MAAERPSNPSSEARRKSTPKKARKPVAGRPAEPSAAKAAKSTAATRTAADKAAPPSSFSLRLPLGQAARVVVDRLSGPALEAMVSQVRKTPSAGPVEDRARLQIKRGGQWITVPSLEPDTVGTVGPPAFAAAAEQSPVLADPSFVTLPAVPEPAALASAASQMALLALLPSRLSTVVPGDLKSLRRLANSGPASMDARLQLAMINRRMGKRGLSIASTSGDELAVVARVHDAAGWEALPDVLPGAELGAAPDGSVIVTGRVAIDRIEAVRAAPVVQSLKASQPVRPQLEATTRTMQVRADLLQAAVKPKGGTGVIVGIVDFGGDFAHRNFRLANGKTRLLAIWNQSGIAQADSPFQYGRLYRREQIDAALLAPDPYAALGYGPRPDTQFERGSHGTHVMDIAAGNGRGSGVAGVAPEADLIFVEASANDVPWQGREVVEKSFGDSVQMLEAIRFIFDLAGDRPCVVNLSLGTNGGPHDGSSLVEQGIDAMVNAKPNRAVVIAASNSQADGIHTSGQVPATGVAEDLVWRVRDHAGGEAEIWFAGAARLELSLIGPDGTVVVDAIQPGDTASIASEDGELAVFVSSRLADPNNGDNVIGVYLAPGLPGGEWIVRLRSLGMNTVDFHAWIERLDAAQSSFGRPVPSHTLGSISTGRHSIVVGSYDAHKASFPISTFSSCGPTRDGREKPEVSAPGGFVMAAHSRTGTGVVRKSGTSMAAPAVTGLLALMLAEAARRGMALSIADIRAKLAAGVDHAPPAQGAWDPRYGAGRASSRAI
jgi:subtilisin family serine protease